MPRRPDLSLNSTIHACRTPETAHPVFISWLRSIPKTVFDSLDHAPGDKLLSRLCFFALFICTAEHICIFTHECDVSVRQILKTKDKCILLIIFQVNISYILGAGRHCEYK